MYIDFGTSIAYQVQNVQCVLYIMNNNLLVLCICMVQGCLILSSLFYYVLLLLAIVATLYMLVMTVT